MTRGGRRFLGLGLLVAVALGVGGFLLINRDSGGDTAEPVTVRGLIGGEKLGFLADQEVRSILADRYGLTVDPTRAGSIEMVQGETTGQDFLWPSSQVALELYQERRGSGDRSEIIFNSPIVMYAWTPVTEALVAAQVVERVGDTYYVNDLRGLVGMIDDGRTWADAGLPQLYGRMSIYTTEPTKSNSGNMFAGLLATTFNGGQVVDDATIDGVLPEVEAFFRRLGYLEESSGELFDQFLKTGMGAKPIIVGYESQLIEFGLQNDAYRDLLREQINVLYPRPTVWSSHPLIALNDGGRRLLDAFKDEELQRLAWERHGFRSGVGLATDPADVDAVGVPATIDSVVPMPRPAVMERIIRTLQAAPARPSTPTARRRRRV